MYVDATTTMCTAVLASYINLPLPGEKGNGFGARRLRHPSNASSLCFMIPKEHF